MPSAPRHYCKHPTSFLIMGSWDETCCITQQGFTGPAYCIVMPYQTDHNILLMFDVFKARIAVGDLDCYGELDEITDSNDPNGKYNTDIYHESEDGEGMAVLFVQKHAWEETIKYIKQNGVAWSDYEDLCDNYEHCTQWRKDKPHQLVFEWWLIVMFLHSIRRNFMDNNVFTGSQDRETKALMFANSLIKEQPEE